MTAQKATIILIAFCLCGLVFMALGLFLKSQKYLNSLQASFDTPQKAQDAVKSGKLCGSIAMGIGGFTLICGIITKLMPELFSYLALVYVIVLIIAFILIFSSIKINNGSNDESK